MKNIISYFIKYPITANLLMFLIFVFGVVGFNSLRSTFFPEVSSRIISIQAVSAGLSPLEIEESITKKIEYKLESISGVKDIIKRVANNGDEISPEALVDRCLDQFGLLEVANETRDELIRNVSPEGPIKGSSDPEVSRRVAETLALIAATREYQFA